MYQLKCEAFKNYSTDMMAKNIDIKCQKYSFLNQKVLGDSIHSNAIVPI